MIDDYSLPCECGAVVSVHAGQCGLDVACESCGEPVHVPDLVSLKRLTGDNHPHLSVEGRLATTLARREPPFDGRCHGCGERAEFAVETRFTFLKERFLTGDEGVLVTPLYSQTVISGSEENWLTVLVPIALCAACRRSFERDRRRSRWWAVIKWVLLIGIVAPLLLLGMIILWIILPVVVLIVLAFGRAHAGKGQGAPGWVQRYLKHLPLYAHLLDRERECRFDMERRVERYEYVMDRMPRE